MAYMVVVVCKPILVFSLSLSQAEQQFYEGYFTHEQKHYKGTLGTHELPPTGSISSHGPSLGPTGSFRLVILDILQG